MATATAVSLCACGSSHFANQTRPPLPVQLSVAITDSRVSVSPASIAAGPVTFTITNLTSNPESLSVAQAGSSAGVGGDLISTSPINPQGTAVVSADLSTPGDYQVSAGGSAAEASASGPTTLASARVHVGPRAPGSGNTLLTP
jgi:hypothetical protein